MGSGDCTCMRVRFPVEIMRRSNAVRERPSAYTGVLVVTRPTPGESCRRQTTYRSCFC
jgi:hypothetical protein